VSEKEKEGESERDRERGREGGRLREGEREREREGERERGRGKDDITQKPAEKGGASSTIFIGAQNRSLTPTVCTHTHTHAQYSSNNKTFNILTRCFPSGLGGAHFLMNCNTSSKEVSRMSGMGYRPSNSGQGDHSNVTGIRISRNYMSIIFFFLLQGT
jgi:hypothetical protein